MAIKDVVMKHVHISTSSRTVSGSARVGEVWATKQELIAVFGTPQWEGNCDDKVFYIWSFETPKGPIHIRDYWWNAREHVDGKWGQFREHSIAGHWEAARWLKRFLKYQGLNTKGDLQ